MLICLCLYLLLFIFSVSLVGLCVSYLLFFRVFIRPIDNWLQMGNPPRS